MVEGEGRLRFVEYTECVTYRVPVRVTPEMSEEAAVLTAEDALTNMDDDEADELQVSFTHNGHLLPEEVE